MSAAEEDKLTDDELVAQVSYAAVVSISAICECRCSLILPPYHTAG